MRNVILFTNTFTQGFGGMEAHFNAAVRYFSKQSKDFKLSFIATNKETFQLRNLDGEIVIKTNSIQQFSQQLQNFTTGDVVYLFNDGHWIEQMDVLRKDHSAALFMMRSGGNEFMKAGIFPHLRLNERQQAWGDIVNHYVDYVISNSNFTTERMLGCGFMREKIVKIRGGADVQVCYDNVQNRKKYRQEFDAIYRTENKTLLVVASRMVKFKGIDVLIEAISNSAYKDTIFLLLVGNGEEYEALHAQCEASLLKGSYSFVGGKTHAQTMRYIAIADLFCNTSQLYGKQSFQETYIHTETMGRSMIEAICHGVPIIATDVGGTKELFEEQTHIGLCVSPKKQK